MGWTHQEESREIIAKEGWHTLNIFNIELRLKQNRKKFSAKEECMPWQGRRDTANRRWENSWNPPITAGAIRKHHSLISQMQILERNSLTSIMVEKREEEEEAC